MLSQISNVYFDDPSNTRILKFSFWINSKILTVKVG